jgi:hypothetical protein
MFRLFGRREKEKQQELARKQAFANRQRIEECEELVEFIAHFLGYIARECITKEELRKLIDYGITPEDLVTNIRQRMENKEGLLLGTQYIRDLAIPVKLTQNYRDRHVYVIGRSGSGKTNLLRMMILQDIEKGNGVGVLAPEQEMITEEILPYIPDERIADVVYVNPADTEYPIPLNPLHLNEGEDIDLKVDEMLTIFNRIMGEASPRMSEILRQTFYALMERKGSTLLDVELLLDRHNPTLRQEIIKTSDDPQTVRFFRDTYPTYPKDASLPITTRIGRLTRPKLVRTLLCQQGSLNFREAMDDGKILLFNLSDGLLGNQTSQLLGQLIVSKIQMAVMSRADTPAAARRPFYLYLDEFQTFTGVAETSYATLLSRARKYRLGLVLAHQQTGQLSLELLQEILGNVSTLIAFNISHTDATRFSHEFILDQHGEITTMNPGELLNLRTGEAIVKVGRSTFAMQTHLVNIKPDPLRAKKIIEESRLNYGEQGPPRNNRPPEPPDDDPDPSQVY